MERGTEEALLQEVDLHQIRDAQERFRKHFALGGDDRDEAGAFDDEHPAGAIISGRDIDRITESGGHEYCTDIRISREYCVPRDSDFTHARSDWNILGDTALNGDTGQETKTNSQEREQAYT